MHGCNEGSKVRALRMSAAQWNFSERGQALTDSAIRALAKRIAATPGIVSFAGGMPSPATFPEQAFASAFDAVMRANGKAALQYGPTDGYPPLRAWVAESLSTPGRRIAPEQVLMISGSQQGLDLIGKVFLDAGDWLGVETPTYLGALQALGMYFPRYLSLPSDDEGLVPDAAEAALRRQPCKLLYAIPTFQNPTGRTLPLARRQALVEACTRTGTILIEDDPYGSLDYEGRQHSTLLSLGDDNVVYLGSFSKVLSPGMRLGFIVAPLPAIRKLEMAKQASDLHTSTLMQHVVFEIIKDGFLDGHLKQCRALYKANADAMEAALRTQLADAAQWVTPKGGMFLWLHLNKAVDAAALVEQALAAGVAYVPGGPFYASEPQHNTMRLCFSTGTAESIVRGVGLLGQVIRAAD